MYIVPERDIAELVDREAAFAAVEAVFAAMASGEARNFPVVREAIGHEDALYGFKGGFDRAGLSLGLKAGGYWPNNLEKRGLIARETCPEDRRGSFAVLTSDGRAMIEAVAPVHVAAVRRHFLDHVDADELAVIGQVMGRVDTALREDRS